MANRVTIISAVTANATGDAVVLNMMSDENMTLHVVGSGTFTFQLEVLQPDGTTWLALRDENRNVVSITASEEIDISIAPNRSVRGVTSSTSSASVSAWISQRGRRGA